MSRIGCAAAVFQLVDAVHLQRARVGQDVDLQVDVGDARLRQFREALVAQLVVGAHAVPVPRGLVGAQVLEVVPQQGAAAANTSIAGAERAQHAGRQALARQLQALREAVAGAARPQHQRHGEQHERRAAPVGQQRALQRQAWPKPFMAE